MLYTLSHLNFFLMIPWKNILHGMVKWLNFNKQMNSFPFWKCSFPSYYQRVLVTQSRGCRLKKFSYTPEFYAKIPTGISIRAPEKILKNFQKFSKILKNSQKFSKILKNSRIRSKIQNSPTPYGSSQQPLEHNHNYVPKIKKKGHPS